MSALILPQSSHEESARERLKGPIRHFLNKQFPFVNWDCMVDLDSGMGIIIATDISEKHGYYIYLDENEHKMQAKLYRAANYILEKFNVNCAEDLLGLPRRVDGEAVAASEED